MAKREDILSENLPALDLAAFGRRVAQLRSLRGWKQRELARRSGIEPARLSRLERGLGVPKLEELVRLRSVLGGTLDELLFEPQAAAGNLGQLVSEAEKHASPEQAEILGKLLHLLSLAFRCDSQQKERSLPC